MLDHLFGWMSPAGPRARLSILIFHRVLPDPDPLLPDEMHARRFESLCGWLARGFHAMPLDDAQRRLVEGTLPARALAITFDDGYADNHDVALPILRRNGLNATFFISTGFLDGGRMWNDTIIESVRGARTASIDIGAAGLPGVDRLNVETTDQRRLAIETLIGGCKYLPMPDRERVAACVARASNAALPRDLMLSTHQVQALHRAGMGIGGHTVRHPILAGLSEGAARLEISAGKQSLEEVTQAPVRLFAYPNGKPGRDYDAQATRLVQEAGFAAAVTTGWGAADALTDRFQLPRFTPWDRSRAKFALRMAQNLLRPATVV